MLRWRRPQDLIDVERLLYLFSMISQLLVWEILWSRSSLEWRHTERNGVTNHGRLDCLLNRLFRRRSKKTWKLRVTDLYEGKPPVTEGFPSQRASNAETVSVWWRHHVARWLVFPVGRWGYVRTWFGFWLHTSKIINVFWRKISCLFK